MSKKRKDILASGGGDASTCPVVDAPPAALSFEDLLTSLPDDLRQAVSNWNLPPLSVAGKPNPAFFQQLLARIGMASVARAATGQSVGFNVDSVRDFINDWAASMGLDPKRIADTRSDAQILAETIDRFEADPEHALEMSADALAKVLAAMRDRMDDADNLTQEYLDQEMRAEEARANKAAEDPSGKAPAPRRRGGLLRRWYILLRQVEMLRRRATLANPRTRGRPLQGAPTDDALAAAHSLRFMIYVARSNMDTGKRFSKRQPTPADFILKVGKHHAKMAADCWMAMEGIDIEYDLGLLRAVITKGVIPYRGIVIMMPPGHGKTEWAISRTALQINERHRTQAVLLHAIDAKAQENLRYLGRYFDPTNEMGRRNLALFPAELEGKVTAKNFKIKAGSLKSPTATASGITAASLGSNTDWQLGDDIVPQSDADQPTERERRKRLMAGTWGTRQRGQRYFRLMIGTPWHYGDALMGMVEQAKRWNESDGREGTCYMVSRQACGGPKENFRPLWPEVYPAEELRARYAELRSASLYAAAYMTNPVADEKRIVKRLRLYDPMDLHEERAGIPEQDRTNRKFLNSAARILSLDPAATRGERSDKAGMVYAAIGTVLMESADENGSVVRSTEKRLRLLDCSDFPATQSELVEHALNYSQIREVDYLYVETRSGFHGTADMFEHYHGIDVRRVDPKSKSKEERLRNAAPAIDDSGAPDLRAVVEFPGVWIEGDDGRKVLKLDPRFRDLAEQILDFGVCDSDHILDALIQVVNDLMSELGVGRGSVTQTARIERQVAKDPRLEAIWSRMRGKKEGGCAEQEEQRWIASNWS